MWKSGLSTNESISIETRNRPQCGHTVQWWCPRHTVSTHRGRNSPSVPAGGSKSLQTAPGPQVPAPRSRSASPHDRSCTSPRRGRPGTRRKRLSVGRPAPLIFEGRRGRQRSGSSDGRPSRQGRSAARRTPARRRRPDTTRRGRAGAVCGAGPGLGWRDGWRRRRTWTEPDGASMRLDRRRNTPHLQRPKHQLDFSDTIVKVKVQNYTNAQDITGRPFNALGAPVCDNINVFSSHLKAASGCRQGPGMDWIHSWIGFDWVVWLWPRFFK